jgi:glucokinase
MFALAIDFGGTKIAVGTARGDGELIACERIETLADRGAEQAVARALELARKLAADARAAGAGECAAAGAVSPGVVQDNRMLLAPNVPGWDGLDLPARLADALGTTVVFGNDVNAAALAEARWGALAGTDAGVFVSLGTGIKAGLVIGGRVFTGAHGAAGEIGYSLRNAADDAGFASGHAPLEEFVGGRALGERASALLGQELSAADVFVIPDLPPGFVGHWLAELTMQVANLAIAIDPQRIALGGGLMAHADTILPALRERVLEAVPFPPDVVPARFLYDGALRGAVALALDGVSELTEVTQ